MTTFNAPRFPALSSLSPEDARALADWANELEREILFRLDGVAEGSANLSPFWSVSVSGYPNRTLPAGASTAQIVDVVGTLVRDLKGKGIVA